MTARCDRQHRHADARRRNRHQLTVQGRAVLCTVEKLSPAVKFPCHGHAVGRQRLEEAELLFQLAQLVVQKLLRCSAEDVGREGHYHSGLAEGHAVRPHVPLLSRRGPARGRTDGHSVCDREWHTRRQLAGLAHCRRHHQHQEQPAKHDGCQNDDRPPPRTWATSPGRVRRECGRLRGLAVSSNVPRGLGRPPSMGVRQVVSAHRATPGVHSANASRAPAAKRRGPRCAMRMIIRGS